MLVVLCISHIPLHFIMHVYTHISPPSPRQTQSRNTPTETHPTNLFGTVVHCQRIHNLFPEAPNSHIWSLRHVKDFLCKTSITPSPTWLEYATISEGPQATQHTVEGVWDVDVCVDVCACGCVWICVDVHVSTPLHTETNLISQHH